MAGEKKTKKMPSAKSAKKSTGKKASGFRSWMMLGVALCVLGGYFYFVNEDARQTQEQRGVPKHVVEKTGAGGNLDFTEKTEQIHRVVEDVLKRQNLTALNEEKVKKTVSRQGIEGEIRWSASTLSITAKESQVKLLKEELTRLLAKIDAEIITVAGDVYQGEKALRMDIGVQDEVEGDAITIIANKLYVLPAQAQPMDKSPPAAAKGPGKAKMALIIDDFGYTKAPIDAYRKIDCPMTFAVLPNHPYSVEAAQVGSTDGRQIILHLPMEAMGDQATEEAQTIHVDMSENEIRATVRELTDAVPHLLGVNNHQGSRATSNRQVMKIILSQLTEQGLFFVDSKTSSSSLAFATAKQMGVPAAENQLFIDNSSDVKLIKAQLNKAADIAMRNGQVIVIGHARPNTAAVLKEMVPELEARGIRFVFVSTLLQ